jgi:hypothetical protein
MMRSLSGLAAMFSVAATIQAAQVAALDDPCGAAFWMISALGFVTCGVYMRGKDTITWR